jgi:hypothetical protein
MFDEAFFHVFWYWSRNVIHISSSETDMEIGKNLLQFFMSITKQTKKNFFQKAAKTVFE